MHPPPSRSTKAILAIALVAAAAGLTACRDRGQDVTGGGWIGDPFDDRQALIGQRETHPEAFAFEPPSAEPPADAPVDDADAVIPVIAPVVDPDGLPAEPTVDEGVAARLAEAKVLAKAGRAALALVEVQRAEMQAPKAPEVLYALGQAHARVGNHREAARAYAALLEQRPNVADALYGQALAHVMQGEPEAARPLLARLEELRPDDANVQRLAARIAGAGALDMSRKAAAQGGLAAQREHADRLAQAGLLPEAANYYGRAAAQAPTDARLHIKWGTALAAAGRLDAATAALQTAVSLDPKSVVAWQTLATVQTRQGKRRAAAQSLEALIAAVPGADASGRLRARIDALRAQP